MAEDGGGEKDMFSMLQNDEEAEEEKKKKLIEEEEEARDEASREIIRDNDVSLPGKSSAFNCALKKICFLHFLILCSWMYVFSHLCLALVLFGR